jgi:nicotinate phosphoribosyltransferase
MNRIINSILDNDLYKFSMMNYALELFPKTVVSYRFKNRGQQRFNKEFLEELNIQINSLKDIKLTDEEYSYLKENYTYLTPGYIEYLKNFRFDPSNIQLSLTEDNNLDLKIKGLWTETVLLEVPLMAIISELYFKIIDTQWVDSDSRIQLHAYNKIKALIKNNCLFADFGTRRRRSFKIQNEVVGVFDRFNKNALSENFVGTSNLFFAKKYGIKGIGTYAHEIPQAMQALESISHSNYYAMQNWIKLFNTELGVALSDTITTEMFLSNFNRRFAMLFSGVRHDSGCPFKFVDKIVDHYKKLNIDPMSKFIIFSDGLNVDKAIEIKEYCEGKINCSFGIGTHFSNDFGGSPALNMVIKLWEVNGFPVVKLGDDEGKENGDPEAIEVVKWIVNKQLGK